MKQFKVNKYITLKLEDHDTFIYVKDERFRQCKFLLLNIVVEEISSFDEIRSIDEIADLLDRFLEPDSLQGVQRSDKISPETEFWGHCSNLQVWAETEYNTRLLHSNLAFPLLKKLTEIGDKTAQKVFKEEIAKRIESGYTPTIKFLIEEDYLDFLDINFVEDLKERGYLDPFLVPLTNRIKKIIEDGNPDDVSILINNNLLKYIDHNILMLLLQNSNVNFIDYIINAMNKDPLTTGEWGFSFFEYVGDILSPIIKNKILLLLKEDKLEELIILWESPAINCLTTKDLNNLISDRSIDLLEKILEALRLTSFDSMFFSSQPFLNKKLEESTKTLLKEKVVEIVKGNSLDEISQLIGLNLFDVFEETDYIILLKDTKLIEDFIKIIEISGYYTKELDNYDFKTIYKHIKLFKKIALADPSIFKRKFLQFIKTCDERDLVSILDFKLLDLIQKDDFIELIRNLKSEEDKNFFRRFCNAIEKVEESDPNFFEDYFWIIDLLKIIKEK
jgi:hypothetical protein